uniref:Uncharacterized protein n=1 Tax=Plectus sambesii TaxID=2011161 RepID=A0A914VSB7_9BILA
MIYATRGIGVFAGGAFGALLTLNPAGAILGATGGGALYDGLATSIAYFVKNKYTPIGLFECFPAVYYTRKNPAANFDAIASVLTTLANDGLFGMAIFKAMKGLGFIKIPEKAAVGSAASSAELAVTTATTEVATASSELAGTTATTEVATASPELAGTTATTEVAAATTSDGGGIPLKNASAVIGEAEAVSRVGAIAPDIACAIGGVCAEAVVNSAHCERTQGLRSPAGSECIVCYERKVNVV